MSPAPEPRYALTELADLAGVTPRTVRYYIAQGLLPGPGSVGPGAKYDDTDLARLRLIRRLQREHQPLAEIRHRLEGLDDDAIVSLVEAPSSPPADSALEYLRRVAADEPRIVGRVIADAPNHPDGAGKRSAFVPSSVGEAPAAYAGPVPADEMADSVAGAPDRIERSQWDRIVLAPDIELHVRRPLPRSTAKRVDRIVSIARDLLEELP